MASPLRDFGLTKPDGTLKSAAELQEDADRLVHAAGVYTEPAGSVAEATSRNQAATVSVTASGGLRSVRLNDGVAALGPAVIADSIMEAYRAATGAAPGAQ